MAARRAVVRLTLGKSTREIILRGASEIRRLLERLVDARRGMARFVEASASTPFTAAVQTSGARSSVAGAFPSTIPTMTVPVE